MKQLKLIIFIFVLTLIQTLLSVYVNIWGIVPNIMLSFVIGYAICQRELPYAVEASLICGVIMSTISGREFFLIMLMLLYSGVLAYMSGEAKRKIPKSVRTVVFTAVFTLIGESVIYLLSNLTFSYAAVLGIIIPSVVFNTVLSVPVYFVTDRFFNGGKKRRKLIIP